MKDPALPLIIKSFQISMESHANALLMCLDSFSFCCCFVAVLCLLESDSPDSKPDIAHTDALV